MIYRTYTDNRGFTWNPNEWTIEREAGTVSIMRGDKLVWEFTDRGESDVDSILRAIAATIVETWS